MVTRGCGGAGVTCDQAFFFFSKGGRVYVCFERNTLRSRERHKGIIGRGHDLRLGPGSGEGYSLAYVPL